MRRPRLVGCSITLAFVVSATVGARWQDVSEPVDVAGIERIRAIGLDPSRSEVMTTASWLTDVYGPRLTGSPNLTKAAEWAAGRLRSWGLDHVALEPWPASTDPNAPNNGFPRGWYNASFAMAAVSPETFAIPGTPMAWTPGTKGRVRGEAVLVTELAAADVQAKYTGRLKGKWVLGSRLPDVQPYWTPPARRYTPEELDRIEARGRAASPARGGRPGGPASPGRGGTAATPFDRYGFFKSEGALGVLTTSAAGHGIYTVSGNARLTPPDAALPAIAIPAEAYGRIARLLDAHQPLMIEADIRNIYVDRPPLFNLVAEIPGTDKADEVVMIGAHLDSWHASTGATDNAAGVAAVMEAMRLLKASGVTLRRTVRVALWTGEEQGLLGSAAYVRRHFGGGPAGRGGGTDPVTPEHATLAAYFNLDEGTGVIRGIYLQRNAAVEPVFRAWMSPLADLGMSRATLSSTGGTDHTSFDEAGLPGWHFMQDDIEYGAMTHHTNLDSYERLLPDDMRKNATIVAAFAYLAATRADLLPRKTALGRQETPDIRRPSPQE
jgi:carboxypeptidase Q